MHIQRIAETAAQYHTLPLADLSQLLFDRHISRARDRQTGEEKPVNRGTLQQWLEPARRAGMLEPGGEGVVWGARAIATQPIIRRYLMRIFVGNLAYTTTDAELRQLFESYGEVRHVMIFVDRITGRSRGFGFVEMPDSTQAQAAMAGLNRSALGGRTLIVNEARPWEE